MFSKNYPNVNYWIETQGWVELGSDEDSDSWVRILDEGGMCWEDEDSVSLDEALKNADIWLSSEIQDRLGEQPPKLYK